MRKIAWAVAALAVVACGNTDVTSPPELDVLFDNSGILVYDAAGLSGPGRYLSALHRLPPNLRLTDAQNAAIKTALDEFNRSVAAEREALAQILKAADEARRAGKPREEVAAILAKGDAIRQRLMAAEQTLQKKIESILTAEQKAWLDGHMRSFCDPRTVPALTDAQITEIRALIAVYEQNNKADLVAVQVAFEKARAAQKNGASREEIKAILHAVQPAIERLAAAQSALLEAIDAVLTAEQRASGCFRGGHITIMRGRR